LLYSFEDFSLDTARRELRRSGALIALQPQVFDLLEYSIRNRERVVSKDDLLAAVWHGRIVSESTLSTRINAARSALGDTGEEQRLLRTAHGKGIRFVGAVREEEKTIHRINAVRKAVGDTGEALPLIRIPPRKGIRFICKVREEHSNSTAVTQWQEPDLLLPDIPSIAVLPFRNLRPDALGGYFGRGIVEDIVVSLAGLRDLFVISSGSTLAYRDIEADPRDVGRVLGVRYIVGGSIRRSGRRLRISCELCDAESGRNIWAERIEAMLGDIFDLQDDLVERFVAQLLHMSGKRRSSERYARGPRH
jgi:TolB-like protein